MFKQFLRHNASAERVIAAPRTHRTAALNAATPMNVDV
jgi:hypothetical protein